ncbi:MAG: histidine phosphatase family protein [Coriobacteriales bacterium]|nr:histidine phosphatase family protein [Coriobacteriales bacterium]
MAATNHRILVMRHPETVANTGRFLSGRKDVELTPAGERQLMQAVDAIVAWRPDRVWSSPLSRCQAIGREAAFRLGVPFEVHMNLQELEFGSVQDVPFDEVARMGYPFPWHIDAQGHSMPAPGAESFEHLRVRAKAFLEELRPLTGRTACVTHGGFTRGLLGAVFDTPLDTFWNISISNVSSQVLTCDGTTFRLAALGLAPQEVITRSMNPSLLGNDTTQSISGVIQHENRN